MTELSIVVKATLVLALALSGAWALRGARASVRALLLTSAFGALRALPAAVLLIPERTIEVPAAYSAAFLFDVIQYENAGVVPIAAGAESINEAVPRRLPSMGSMLRTVWALGAMGLLLRLVLALK